VVALVVIQVMAVMPLRQSVRKLVVPVLGVAVVVVLVVGVVIPLVLEVAALGYLVKELVAQQ
jgi:hypothetical protein